jgi:hypothetical protein
MAWWAWLLVDLFLLAVAAAVTVRVGWHTWQRFRRTLRSLSLLDIPAVERPVRE